MGTKANPSKYDCYAKAADDEPIFTLRAKDPIAPMLVRAWIQLRCGHRLSAISEMLRAYDKLDTLGMNSRMNEIDQKAFEADHCAIDMEEWYRENVGEKSSLSISLDEVIQKSQTKESK